MYAEHSAEIDTLLAEPSSPPRARKLLLTAIFIFLLAMLISYVPDIRRIPNTSARDGALFGLVMHMCTAVVVAYPWRNHFMVRDALGMLGLGLVCSLREFCRSSYLKFTVNLFRSLHSCLGRRCSAQFEITYIWRGCLPCHELADHSYLFLSDHADSLCWGDISCCSSNWQDVLVYG